MTTRTRIFDAQRQRGMALVLVLAAIALASVIGFAMLATSALQAQVTVNATQRNSSEYLAESGVQAAMYYLQYPQLMPPTWGVTPGYYIHATNVTLPRTQGSFDLEVTPTSTRDRYTIKATGRAAADASPHVITASAQVQRALANGAGLFGGDIKLPQGMTIDGPVIANGSVINLTGQAISIVSAPLPMTAYRVPSAAQINYWGAERIDRRYVMPDGTVGYAQQLLAAPTTPPIAAGDNPGKVFFYSNLSAPDLNLTSSISIDGTLIVKGGSLSVRANGIRLTPVSGLPALIVEKDVNLYRTNNTLEANGAVWIGSKVTWTTLLGSSSGSQLKVNGALLMPAGAEINAPGASGSISVKYEAAKVDVPLLSTVTQPGTSVTVLSWNE